MNETKRSAAIGEETFHPYPRTVAQRTKAASRTASQTLQVVNLSLTHQSAAAVGEHQREIPSHGFGGILLTDNWAPGTIGR